MISLSLLLSSHLRIFQHSRVRSSTWCYPGFNLLKSRSPPLRVYCPRLSAPFVLGFPSPARRNRLGWPRTITRRLIMQKAGGHPLRGSHTLYASGFRYYFTPLTGVLFTFPSRYWFTIGCQGVFSLIPWSGRIHAEFHLHCATWDSSKGSRASLTRLSRSMADLSRSLSSLATSHVEVPLPREDKSSRFGLFRFRSPLLTESLRFLFLGLLRCFTSPRMALPDYAFLRQSLLLKAARLSHSEIHGSTPVCGYPWLIATCYVLPRLLAPRHPPLALSSLITNLAS